MATWALLLSFVICIPLAVLAAVVLAVMVLSRASGSHRDHGRGKAIAALSISAAWLVLGIVAVAAGLLTGGGSGDRAELALGSCFSADGDLTTGEVDESSVDIVSCSASHDWQVYGQSVVPGADDYPGDAAVEREAAACVEQFAGFVGRALRRSELTVVYLPPTAETWAETHSVLCVVGDPAGQVIGSLKNADR